MPRDPVIAGKDRHDRAPNSRRPTRRSREPSGNLFDAAKRIFGLFDAAEIVANASSRALIQRRQPLYERAKIAEGQSGIN
jgi:hypothetical protein